VTGSVGLCPFLKTGKQRQFFPGSLICKTRLSESAVVLVISTFYAPDMVDKDNYILTQEYTYRGQAGSDIDCRF